MHQCLSAASSPPGPSTASVDISDCFPAAARVPVSLQLQCGGESRRLLSPPPGPRALTALVSQLVGVAPLHISSLQLVNITREGLGLRLELATNLREVSVINTEVPFRHLPTLLLQTTAAAPPFPWW